MNHGNLQSDLEPSDWAERKDKWRAVMLNIQAHPFGMAMTVQSLTRLGCIQPQAKCQTRAWKTEQNCHAAGNRDWPVQNHVRRVSYLQREASAYPSVAGIWPNGTLFWVIWLSSMLWSDKNVEHAQQNGFHYSVQIVGRKQIGMGHCNGYNAWAVLAMGVSCAFLLRGLWNHHGWCSVEYSPCFWPWILSMTSQQCRLPVIARGDRCLNPQTTPEVGVPNTSKGMTGGFWKTREY